jgi:hypothetical protein
LFNARRRKRFYHERAVDPQTGALGAPEQIFAWYTDTDGNPDSVQIIKGLFFDFVSPVQGQPLNSLQVFPIITSKNPKPLVDCSWVNSPVCGADAGVAHPSAKYVFYTNLQKSTIEVDAVDLSSKQIVPTGTVLSTSTPLVPEFSPDGSVVYAWDRSTSNTISIFGFNVSTAAIIPGGVVTESNIVSILPAVGR